MDTGYKAETTRIEVEISLAWAENDPDLFVKSLCKSIQDFHNYKLYDVKLKFNRVGFITLVAEKQLTA